VSTQVVCGLLSWVDVAERGCVTALDGV
jgi:hypothetical protein